MWYLLIAHVGGSRIPVGAHNVRGFTCRTWETRIILRILICYLRSSFLVRLIQRHYFVASSNSPVPERIAFCVCVRYPKKQSIREPGEPGEVYVTRKCVE